MEAAKQLEDEITHYLAHLNTRQKEVVLSVVKSFAGEEEQWWDEKVYHADMANRFSEMESGKVKLYSLDEIESGARKAYMDKKGKK